MKILVSASLCVQELRCPSECDTDESLNTVKVYKIKSPPKKILCGNHLFYAMKICLDISALILVQVYVSMTTMEQSATDRVTAPTGVHGSGRNAKICYMESI